MVGKGCGAGGVEGGEAAAVTLSPSPAAAAAAAPVCSGGNIDRDDLAEIRL